MITIKELAKLANVSQSTVSKALNDRPDVSPQTKSKIFAIAQQHQFTPNAFGRGLKSKITENIGAIFCREPRSLSGNPFYSRVLEGIEAEVAINNFNLVLHLAARSQTGQLPKMLREKQIDGLILVGVIEEDMIQAIAETNIPVVLVDPKIDVATHSRVLIDNEHGAFTATQYLISHGHRRIAFISGDLNRLSFKQRLDGYLKALNFHRIAVDEDLIQTGGFEKGYEHVQALLALQNPPTAIFAANDQNAIFGYQAVRERGLKIPGDLSFIGFDDIDLARLSDPPLTTIRVYKEELGSIAVRELLRLVRKEGERPQATIVPIRLVERESVKNVERGV